MPRSDETVLGTRWPFALALALLAPGVAGAATYYVAPPPTGDDVHGGTEAQPWATLQHAADLISAGDEVLVADGEYTGFRLTTTGTAAAPLAFRATADAAVVNAPFAPDGPGIDLEVAGYVTIEGFRIQGVPAAGIQATAPGGGAIRGLVLRGNRIADVGGTGDAACIVVVAAADATIEDNIVHDCAGAGLRLDGAVSTVLQNNIVYGTTGDGILVQGGASVAGPSGVVVVNNTVHVPAAGGWALHLAARGTAGLADNVVFNDLLFSDNPATGGIALEGELGFASARDLVTDRLSTDDGATVVTLAGFMALGYELGSLASDPTRVLADPVSGDYHIRAGCAAIDLGLPELNGHVAPSFDIVGTGRPVGASYDVGAYEFCVGWTCEGADAGPDGDGGADADADGDGGTGGGGGGGCGCRAAGERATGGSFGLAVVGCWSLVLGSWYRRRCASRGERPTKNQ